MRPLPRKQPAGFTLLEIVVALSVFATVAAAGLKVTLRVRRTYQEQLDRIALQGDLRVGMAIVASELRGLDANDPDGSDLIEIGPDRIGYNATRVVAFVCRPAARDARTVFVWRDFTFGERNFDPRSDSLLVYLGAGRWARTDLSSVAAGGSCPGESAGLALSIAGAGLPPLPVGTPVHGFEGARLRLYSSNGLWLGSNRRYKTGEWTRTQPLVGPLAPGGFRLEYRGAGGAVALGAETSVIGVRLIIEGRSGRTRDTLQTTLSLRNNGGVQ